MREPLMRKLPIVVALTAAVAHLPSAAAGDQRGLLRYNPIYETLDPIDRGSIKPGYVYSHFDQKLGRRVWSYLKQDGTFWNALGEGTTIEGWRFDVQDPEKVTRELEKINPRLEEEINKARPVRFRLQADGGWEMIGTQAVQSVFDAETGHRWEKHGDRYRAVRSTWGYRWQPQGGGYRALDGPSCR